LLILSGNIISIEIKKQLQPYLAGRKNIQPYPAIPHITTPEQGGLQLNSAYGDGPELTRAERKRQWVICNRSH
jgi:hypothetical protein